MLHRHALGFAAAIAIFAAPFAAQAQDYPTRPVKIVVPFGAGGPADVYARFLSQKLQDALGQPFIVDNRPGGGSVIGTDVVAKSFDLDVDQPVVEAVQRVAEQRDVPMAHVALAWVLSKPVVSAPLVGATKPHHLADAAAALDLQLTEDEIAAMEKPYSAQAPYWW